MTERDSTPTPEPSSDPASSIYKVIHSTTYQYQAPVKVSHNQVMLTPRDAEFLKCRKHRLTIQPGTSVSTKRTDFFGNLVHAFSVEENHRRLVVTASSVVEVLPRPQFVMDRSPSWQDVANDVKQLLDQNWLEVSAYRFDSRRIRRQQSFAEYAQGTFKQGMPILEAALALTQKIYTEFQYDTKATDVNTSVDQAFTLRRGVCQDFAQIQIAALRSLGLPARYVSGYLRTLPPEGKPRLIGADQSHAWVSLYCGQDLGWVDLDPTNRCFCGLDHVPIARGRDYSDVVPFRGVFLGGGSHQLTVSVDVCPVD